MAFKMKGHALPGINQSKDSPIRMTANRDMLERSNNNKEK